MKYILDTNALSYLMKGDPAVARNLLARSRANVLLPQPVVAEIEYGLSKLGRSKRKARLQQRFEGFLEEFSRVEWTDDVSREFGRAKASLERRGERLEDLDVAVAAHALALGGTLVTADTDHMKRVPGLRVENWKS